MKNHSKAVAMTILCWFAATTAALAKCEPILAVSARSWGLDLQVTSASTQGDCAYVIVAMPVAISAARATIPSAMANSWTYLRPREADTCQQQRRTSAAYGPPAGVSCLANLKNGDSASLLLQRLAAVQDECYDVTVRPVLAEALHPARARQLVCLAPASDQIATQFAP